MKILAKIYSISLLVLCLVLIGVVPASAESADSQYNDGYRIEMTDELSEGLALVGKISDYLQFKDNKFTLTESIDSVSQKLNLSDHEVMLIEDMVDFASFSLEKEVTLPNTNSRVYVKGWKVHFTKSDVFAMVQATGVSTAVILSQPHIIIGIMAMMGSVVPGVGTVIGALIGAVAGGTIAYTLVQAYFRGQGVWMGIEWNGIFPNFGHGYF